MHGGSDDRLMLAPQLDDVLPEIGLDRLNAGCRQRLVELDLLADHRLPLVTLRAPSRRAMAMMIRFASSPSAAKWTWPAARLDLGLVALEIEIEMGERALIARACSRSASNSGRSRARESFWMKPRGTFSERPLQRGIVERPCGILLERAARRPIRRDLPADRRAAGPRRPAPLRHAAPLCETPRATACPPC